MRCHRWLLLLVLLIGMAQLVSSKSTACYSCVSLNYRVTVPSRNGPLPPAQDAKNLSQLFEAMRRTGLQVPHLDDTCADMSPYSSSSTFMQAPIILCREKRCAKLLFRFKGEKVVVRNCISNMFTDPTLMQSYKRVCTSKPTKSSFGPLNNISFCECERDLCNSSSVPFIYELVKLILFYLMLQAGFV